MSGMGGICQRRKIKNDRWTYTQYKVRRKEGIEDNSWWNTISQNGGSLRLRIYRDKDELNPVSSFLDLERIGKRYGLPKTLEEYRDDQLGRLIHLYEPTIYNQEGLSRLDVLKSLRDFTRTLRQEVGDYREIPGEAKD